MSLLGELCWIDFNVIFELNRYIHVKIFVYVKYVCKILYVSVVLPFSI
jgi:hypothetical protein